MDTDYAYRLRDVQVHHVLHLLKSSELWIIDPYSFRPVSKNVTRRDSPDQKGRVQQNWKKTNQILRLLVHLYLHSFFFCMYCHIGLETLNVLHGDFCVVITVPDQSANTSAILLRVRLQLALENVQIPPIWVLQSSHPQDFSSFVHVFERLYPLHNHVKRILLDLLLITSLRNPQLHRGTHSLLQQGW